MSFVEFTKSIHGNFIAWSTVLLHTFDPVIKFKEYNLVECFVDIPQLKPTELMGKIPRDSEPPINTEVNVIIKNPGEHRRLHERPMHSAMECNMRAKPVNYSEYFLDEEKLEKPNSSAFKSESVGSRAPTGCTQVHVKS